MAEKYLKHRASNYAHHMRWLVSIGVMLFLLGILVWGHHPNSVEIASRTGVPIGAPK